MSNWSTRFQLVYAAIVSFLCLQFEIVQRTVKSSSNLYQEIIRGSPFTILFETHTFLIVAQFDSQLTLTKKIGIAKLVSSFTTGDE